MLLDRFFQKTYPVLDWIQVEVSSYCNANCVYCPHTAYRSSWQNRLLPLDAFRLLIPAFSWTKLVYLQGWGEPFTHPNFFETMRIAKGAGCTVGTTTNGMLLHRESMERLVQEGLDVIGFSLAGVDERNDSIRRGTRIDKVLKCIEEIQRIKQRHGNDTPKIHIAYMLLRSRLDDLDRLPGFLAGLGVSQTVISSLSLVVNPEMEAESLLPCDNSEYSELTIRLEETRAAAEKRGSEVHFHIVSPETDRFQCNENVTGALIVGSDGGVSPCVMTQIPVESENLHHHVRGQRFPLQKLAFGNIMKASLNQIWHQAEYRRFVRAVLKGLVPSVCRSCLKRSVNDLT